MRLVPHADLANFDPIWSRGDIVRNAGLLVWDTLYGLDKTLTPRRQMVEAEEVSADGLTWTFQRPGLKFHDGEPVLAKDAVASISRWAARDPMGQMIKGIEDELIATGDRTFRWALKKPHPKTLLALGKMTTSLGRLKSGSTCRPSPPPASPCEACRRPGQRPIEGDWIVCRIPLR